MGARSLGSPRPKHMVRLLLVALAWMAVTAAAHGQSPPEGGLVAFASDADLAAYVNSLRERRCPTEVGAGQPTIRVAATGGEGTVVTGVTLDALDGEPLLFASVAVVGKRAGAAADVDGRFRLELDSLVAGRTEVRLRASFTGYLPIEVVVPLSPGDSVAVTFPFCVADDLVAVSTGWGPAPPPGTPGVDEGGVVKALGDYLLVLRGERLFAVDTRGGMLSLADVINLYEPGLAPEGAAYDEMLVVEDTVVLVGRSQRRAERDVGLFGLDGGGRLRHRASYQLRSDLNSLVLDHTSRAVDGQLVFYEPLGLPNDGALADALPGLRRWRGGDREADPFEPIAAVASVYRSAATMGPRDVTLHAVTTCEIEGAEMSCQATVAFGPWSDAVHVSRTAVYAWFAPRSGSAGDSAAPTLYRVPLDGSPPASLAVRDRPADLAAFDERDGHLDVLVTGEWRYDPEPPRADLSLLRVPLADLHGGTRRAPESWYRRLPDRAPGVSRFVGRHLLQGAHESDASGRTWPLRVIDRETGASRTLALPHPAEQIEPMGDAAAVIGWADGGLHVTALRLSPRPSVAGEYVLAGAPRTYPRRSYELFYRRDGDERGVVGLPIRQAGDSPTTSPGEGSASVAFLENRQLALSPLGTLDSSDLEREPSEERPRSRLDWYDNAQPVFSRGRVFALLGDEMIEGVLERGRLREVQRLDLASER